MRLVPHTGVSPGWVRAFTVEADRRAGGTLRLCYSLDADLGQLCIPAGSTPTRADGLWRHTCFEAFLAAAGAPAYCELNFSPSGAWAAYGFTGYRNGMRSLVLPVIPKAEWRSDTQGLHLAVEIRAADFLGDLARGPLRMGLSAVLEEQSGTISYWALRHPAGQADFHDAAGFALELAPDAGTARGGAAGA